MDKNMPSKNEGIIITGGTINARVIAIKAHITELASGAPEKKGLQEILDKLDEMVNAITTHADAFPEPDEVLDSTEVVAEELSKDKPNKRTLTAVLNGIASSVQSVTAVATAVEALKHAIASLLI